MAIKFLNTVAVDTDVLYVDASNDRVGIGTPSPGYKLDVNGTGRFTSTLTMNASINMATSGSSLNLNSSGWVTFYGNNNSSHAIGSRSNTGAVADDIRVNSYGAVYINLDSNNNNTSGADFAIGRHGGPLGTISELFRVSGETGNVGIGTTSPFSKLEVVGDTSFALLTLKSLSGGTNDAFMRFFNEGAGGSYSVGQDSSDGKFKIAYDVDGNSLTTGTKLVLDSSGNVGIGTTSPSQKLHVAGTGLFSSSLYLGDTNCALFRFFGALVITNNGSTTISLGGGPGNVNNNVFVGNGYLDVNGYIRGKNYFYLEDANGTVRTTLRSESTYATLDNGTNTLNTIANAHVFLRSSTEVMRIHTNNNVGIGTTSPSYKLDVTGEGRFTGDLRCLSLIQTSERDYKKDIRLVGKENSTIPIKEYKYKTGDNDKVRYGVVAEDIESTYPELVERDADGIKGVKYIDLLVRKIAELETEKRTLANWRHYHSNTSYNTLYDTGMTTAFPYAYGSIPAPYDMYFTSVTLVNNPYSSYTKGPLGDTATFQAYVNGNLAYEIRDIRYGQNPYESITADFGQNVRIRRGESLQIRFYANGVWRYCNSTIILTEI